MKQKVTNIETKEVMTVEAIDAKEMVKTGGWDFGEVVDSESVKKKPGTKNPGKTLADIPKISMDKVE